MDNLLIALLHRTPEAVQWARDHNLIHWHAAKWGCKPGCSFLKPAGERPGGKRWVITAKGTQRGRARSGRSRSSTARLSKVDQ